MSNPFLPSTCHVCGEVFTPIPRDSLDARKLPPEEYAKAVNSFVALSEHVRVHHPEVCHVCPRSAGGVIFGTYWTPEDNTCSYCGSMHPDEFMKALWARKELIPTDKSYKVYVRSEGGQEKFYFQHLSEIQRDQFVDLLNTGKLKFGYPGHFYTLPFFVRAR